MSIDEIKKSIKERVGKLPLDFIDDEITVRISGGKSWRWFTVYKDQRTITQFPIKLDLFKNNVTINNFELDRESNGWPIVKYSKGKHTYPIDEFARLIYFYLPNTDKRGA